MDKYQEGKKLYCKKDYFVRRRNDKYGKARIDIVKRFRNGLITSEQMLEESDKLTDGTSKEWYDIQLLSEGTTYVIVSTLLKEITILDDENDTMHIFNDSDCSLKREEDKDGYLMCSEYFLNETELRKEKLSTIDDNRFMDFLRNLKK